MKLEAIPGYVKLTDWWLTVPPERKRVMLISLIVAFVLVTSAVFRKDRAPAVKPQQTKLDMSVVTAPRKEEGVQELRALVDTLKGQIAQSRAAEEAIRTDIALMKETGRERENAKFSDLAKELQEMKEDVRSYKSDILGAGGAKNLPIPVLPDAPKDDKPAPPEIKRPRIRISGDDPAPTQVAQNAVPTSVNSVVSGVVGADKPGAAGPQLSGVTKNPNAPVVSDREMQFLPAGSLFKGVLINGFDAPTSSMAQKRPVPALLRVKSLAFLPNRVTQDIRECFIIISGYGVMSTERADMRTETLTCIRTDGGVIETPLDGFVVDTFDGKQGIHGQLVTKQGSLIARSLVSGFISGFSQIMKPTQVMGLNTNPGSTQGWQSPDLGMAASAGAANGVGQAANDISRFFLDTAKEMHPVVEVPAQTEVDVILVRGTSLALGVAKGNRSASTFLR